MRRKWIQDPKTKKLVPAEEYRRATPSTKLHVMPDIKPFVSVCGDMAGKEISGRKQLREFEKRNGLMQVGNATDYVDKPDPKQQEREHREAVKRDLHRAYGDLNA